MKAANLFNLTGRVAVITGAAGLLGIQHARAIHAAGGIPIITDIDETRLVRAARQVGRRALALRMDITDEGSVEKVRKEILKRYRRLDILINNAARNPKVETGDSLIGLEKMRIEDWNADLAVGLTGALICSRVFGAHMASRGEGVILNIASELALIAPNQGLYRKTGRPASRQPKKPASYSVVKAGLVGLTRYLATYWAKDGVRVNALCPGGVENGQPSEFITRMSKLVPMGRMARVNEYQGAVIFLCSEASSFMTGSIVSVDGGRTAW